MKLVQKVRKESGNLKLVIRKTSENLKLQGNRICNWYSQGILNRDKKSGNLILVQKLREKSGNLKVIVMETADNLKLVQKVWENPRMKLMQKVREFEIGTKSQ